MAVPQGGIDWRTSSLADFLEYAAQMTPQELVAALRDMRQATGLSLPVVQAVTSGPVTDAFGAIPVTLHDATGAALASSNGTGITRGIAVQGTDDISGSRILLTDRAGILAVGPPVTKLWSQIAQNVGAAISVAQAAPGANLYLVVLAWGYSIACAAAALAPGTVSAVGAGARLGASVACPINDSRHWEGSGPVLATAVNTGITITGPAAPAAANHTLWMVGYTAAAP